MDTTAQLRLFLMSLEDNQLVVMLDLLSIEQWQMLDNLHKAVMTEEEKILDEAVLKEGNKRAN